jgi:glycine cleavage system H lipoate-binding protein
MTTLVSARALCLYLRTGLVGISDYAQQLLGDVVYVELPPVDAFVNKGGAFSVNVTP